MATALKPGLRKMMWVAVVGQVVVGTMLVAYASECWAAGLVVLALGQYLYYLATPDVPEAWSPRSVLGVVMTLLGAGVVLYFSAAQLLSR